jgi:serine/threonine-protein kinase
MMAPKSRPTGTTWAIRFGVAALLGALLGAGSGIYAVNVLDPARAKGVDSLRTVPDSLANRARRADWPAAVGSPAGGSTADQPLTDAPLTTVTVPSVVDLEEGNARSAMIDMGLQVAGVQFQASTRPAGTVLGTMPAAGTLVAVQTPITLLVSDGRAPAPDSTTSAPHLFDPLSNP